jgi:hypothetical protein
MNVYFAVNQKSMADALVEEFHYSHRPPANVQLVGTWHEPGGLFGDFGIPVAACFFSIPPTRWSEPVLELSRLVRRDDFNGSLTGLISQTVNVLRRKKIVDLVVSFADSTFEHHGGIYQAASWFFSGKRESRMDGLLINGIFHAGRSLNSNYGTRSPSKLKQQLIHDDIEPHYDKGKYLYWKALTRRGIKQAERMNLSKLPYPKPATRDKEY